MPDGEAERPTSLVDLRYGSLAEVTAARARVLEALRGPAISTDSLDDAVLMMSELMTNALRHTDTSSPRLRIDLLGDDLRVAVTDTGRGVPTIPDLDPSRIGGNGLRIVAAIATSWGTEVHDGLGKTVWFLLPTHR